MSNTLYRGMIKDAQGNVFDVMEMAGGSRLRLKKILRNAVACYSTYNDVHEFTYAIIGNPRSNTVNFADFQQAKFYPVANLDNVKGNI
jgi:hypothetical protein